MAEAQIAELLPFLPEINLTICHGPEYEWIFTRWYPDGARAYFYTREDFYWGPDSG